MVGVELGRLVGHFERLVRALHHTFGATFAKIRDHDGEEPTRTLLFALQRAEGPCCLVKREWNPLEKLHKLAASDIVDPVKACNFRLDQLLEWCRSLVGDLGGHRGSETGL